MSLERIQSSQLSYSAGPPGFEEVNVSKSAAMHISALHLTREAFIECEADRVLKTALKQRVYARGEDISPGDWIYFKNKTRKWEGPVRVTTKHGKLLYSVRAGKLLSINADHADLVRSEGNILQGEKTAVEDPKNIEKAKNNQKTEEMALEQFAAPEHQPAVPIVEVAQVFDPEQNNPPVSTPEQNRLPVSSPEQSRLPSSAPEQNTTPGLSSKQIPYQELKKGMKITYKK